MKISRLKKSLIFAFFALIFAGVIWILLGSNTTVFASAASNDSSYNATGVEIEGPTRVYSGEYVTYKSHTESFSFVTFESENKEVEIGDVLREDDYTYSVVVHINENLPLYSTFKLTATDIVSNTSNSITISVLPVYANEIGSVAMLVNNTPLDKKNPVVRPGDKVEIQIESFVVDGVTYRMAEDVSYPEFVVVLDKASEQYAQTDDAKISIEILKDMKEDNPIVTFTVAIIQHKAPLEIQNLTKKLELQVYIPVKTLNVNTSTGQIKRGTTLVYSVNYNSTNVASVKGVKLSKSKLDGSSKDYSNYFDIIPVSEYQFNIAIDKNAPYGAGIKLKITSEDETQITVYKNISVSLLEAGYTVSYSKDYQGATNSDNGVQLKETNNKTQLRNGYNADFYLVGSTTGKAYTVDELAGWGVDVKLTYSNSSYFEIIGNKKISMNINAPAYTNNQRTTYSYSIEIADGSWSYSTINKSVEVFRSLGNSTYTNFYLSGTSGNKLTSTSHNIVFSLQGSNFTATTSDISFTSSDSAFTISNKTFKATNAANAGDTIRITAKSNVYYNGVNVDSNWGPSIYAYRRFVASQNHLQKLNSARSDDTYYIINDIYLSGYWTPISFEGILEGQYHTIYNMTISLTARYDQPIGLFSENIGKIKNITLSNYSIYVSTSSSSIFVTVGAIAGYNSYEAQVYDCETESGTITVYHHNSHVGSIVGQNQGLVYNCFSNSGNNLKGYGYLGGIVGFNTAGGVVQASTSYTKIYYTWNTENKSIGGVVGYNDTNSTVTTSYFGGYIEWKCTNDSKDIKPSIGYIIGCNKGNYSSCDKIMTPTKLIECKSGGWWLWAWNQADNCFKIDGEKVGSN